MRTMPVIIIVSLVVCAIYVALSQLKYELWHIVGLLLSLKALGTVEQLAKEEGL